MKSVFTVLHSPCEDGPATMQFTRRLFAIVISILFVVFLSAISPTQSRSQSGRTYQPTRSQGSVTGVISFSGRPPARKRIARGGDPSCVKANPRALTEDILAKQSHLANVFVYVKSGSALEGLTFETPSVPVVLDQRGCRYAPHVLGIRVGQILEIRNSDPTTHNEHEAPKNNPKYNQSQVMGAAPITRQFAHPEIMIPINCFQHPWMIAYLGVLTHPFFAVSDRNGRFRIEGLPPGNYTIAAWHERFGEKAIEITIDPPAQQTVSFEFRSADDRGERSPRY